MSIAQLREHFGVSRDTMAAWLRDEPIPEWTRRPRAKDDLRAQAVTLRREGETVPRIARALGVSKSTAYLWVGELSDREVRLLGAVAYWCEGAKTKPWRPHRCQVTFINGDPVLIRLFIRFLEHMGEDRTGLTYRVSIHESADAEAAGRWWAEVVGVPFEIFRRPTLKTHNPSTVRHNIGDPYRGCLIVDVPKSRELYWRIEGLMRGIASEPGCGGDASM